MGEFQLARLDSMIHLVWAVPLVLLACAWGVARRRQVLERFGIELSRHGRFLHGCTRRRWLRATTLSVAVILLTAAAVEPRLNPQKTRFKKKARDIAVLLDVSRSMLAEDLKPSRLARAKLELERLCDHLQGDRIGLIAFAGDAVIECPLTSNYSYFESVLRNVGPASASQGGTRIGDAIRKALRDLFGIEPRAGSRRPGEVRPGETVMEAEARSGPPEERFTDIILVTDGEDHDSHPLHAAEQAAEAGTSLLIVGLGSERGTPIPVQAEDGSTRYLEYKGEVVLSKLDSRTLVEMAQKAGWFLPAGTDNFDLVETFEETIGREEGREIYEEHMSWTEVFQPFLLAGLVFYLLSIATAERPSRQETIEITKVEAA